MAALPFIRLGNSLDAMGPIVVIRKFDNAEIFHFETQDTKQHDKTTLKNPCSMDFES